MQTLEHTAQEQDMCLSEEYLESRYGHLEGSKGWIVDGAGGWPQAWLDTEEETMKGRLS